MPQPVCTATATVPKLRLPAILLIKNRCLPPPANVYGRAYITLINPAPNKGFALFFRLALEFARTHPQQRFLVVNNISTYSDTLSQLHNPDGTKFLTPDNQSSVLPQNIDVAQHTDDVRQIYALTKVLVAPSLCHECWGNVATEATFNGIPVLCSDSGGLPEAIREGGIALPAPAETVKDYLRIPTREEMEPWLTALERLLTQDWSEACRKAAEVNDIRYSTDRLLEMLTPLLREGRNRKNLKESWYYSRKEVAKRLGLKTIVKDSKTQNGKDGTQAS